ncbi:uncharacterized protein LOC100203165 [Hydra vulgaris]|uniref:uncharacterized protein LOC100203165 n=1 Tax=Hydra vulgaris TaxID=6087 RepID=UPI001F5E3A9E|nr:uncharacterized protein LOC100203165 isoform X1 [Hydra vulgaris]
MHLKITALIQLVGIYFMLGRCTTRHYSKHTKLQNAVNRDIIPTLADLFSKKTESGTEYAILGCKVINSIDGCLWSFTPDEKCQDNLSLDKVYNLLLSKSNGGNHNLANIIKVFPIESFVVKKFVLSTCGKDNGLVNFICNSVKPFDIIEDKLKAVKVELEINFNYIDFASSFSYSDIAFTIKGEVQIGTQSLNVEFIKVKNVLSEVFKLSSNAIKAADIYKVFSAKKLTDEQNDLLKTGGMFSNLVIEETLVTGSRNEDGSYQMVINGKATGIAGFNEIKSFIVIQKPYDKPAGVGIIVSLKNVQPLKILSRIIGKDLTSIEIIKDVEVDLVVHYANQDITELGNQELADLMNPFLENGNSLVKGAVISLTIPIKDILKKIGTASNIEEMSKSISIQILIKEDKISFKFSDDMFNDGIKFLAAIVPKAAENLQKYIFNDKITIKFEIFEVNIKTKEVNIAVSLGNNVLIKFITLKNVYFHIIYDMSGEFQFKLNAALELSGATAEIIIEKKGKKFELSGSVASLTSDQLLKTFGTINLVENVEKKPKLNFGICDLKVSGTFGEGVPLEIRLSGNPVLFDWDGLKFEGFIMQEGINSKRYKTDLKPLQHSSKSFFMQNITQTKDYPISKNYYNGSLQNDIEPSEIYFLQQEDEKRSNIINDIEPSQIFFPQQEDEKISNIINDIEPSQIFFPQQEDEKRSNIVERSVEMTGYQMGLAVYMKNIRLDHIAGQLSKQLVSGIDWMVNLNVALVMSNTNQNNFNTEEIKKVVNDVMVDDFKRGVYFCGELKIPEDCKQNQLCEFSKKRMNPGAKLFVTAGFNDNGFKLKAGYNGGSLELFKNNDKSITLNSAYFDLSLGLNTEFMLKAKLTLDVPETLVFDVGIGFTGSGGIKFTSTMIGMWTPFSFLSIGNTELAVALQPPLFNPTELGLTGQVNIGKKGKEIVVKASGGINLLNPKDFYIYASINKLTFAACIEAFGFDMKLPQVILDTGFPNGLMIGVAMFRDVEIKQLGINVAKGLTLQGTVNILGYTLKAVLRVDPYKSFELDTQLSPINLFDEAFGLYLSMEDKTRGPKIFIHISSSMVKFEIRGSITVLGISAEVTIKIGDEGLHFNVAGKLFGLFEANLTVNAPYSSKMSINTAGFSVKSCLSANMGDASKEADAVLKNTVKDSLDAESKLMSKKENAYRRLDFISKSFDKLEEKLNNLKSSMTLSAQSLKDYEKELNAGCKGFFDLSCQKRLIGIKVKVIVIKAKQIFRDRLYTTFEKLLLAARTLLNKAKLLFNQLESVYNTAIKGISAGLEAAKQIGEFITKNIIQIHYACFETSLEKAAMRCFGLNLKLTLLGKDKTVNVQACLDLSFTKTIGRVVTNFLYPGASDVNDRIKNSMGQMENVEQSLNQVDNSYKETDSEVNSKNGDFNSAMKKDDDDNNKKHDITKKWTMAEIRHQMYSDTPTFLDRNMFEFTYPVSTMNNEERAEIPLDVDSLYQVLSDEKDKCLQRKTLASGFLQISDHIQTMQKRINIKRKSLMHAKKLFDYNMNVLEKFAIEKCKLENCTSDMNEELLQFIEKHRNAHLDHMKNLDHDLSQTEKRFLTKARESVEHQVLKKNETIETFFEMLKNASKNVTKNSVLRKHFDTAYKVLVKKFLVNEKSNHDVRMLKKVKTQMAEIRDHIPCAA